MDIGLPSILPESKTDRHKVSDGLMQSIKGEKNNVDLYPLGEARKKEKRRLLHACAV
jgi:hypothetical protein